MRLSLFILGVFAATVCTEKSAASEQNYPWCINKPDTPPQCRVPVRNIRTMLGRPAWERRVLFT
jgi:hypothetical protein